jgi:alcohol dehydrogenase
MGCTVYTTVGSNDKIEKAKALGADHVINYREDRFEGVMRKLTKKKGVDVVFEHVGADTWAGSMLSLKRGGRLVTCGSTSGVSTNMNLMMLFQQQLKLLGSFGCRMENMADAMQKMAQGQVSPVIDTVVGFDQIDTVLKRMESRDVFGKIILTID